MKKVYQALIVLSFLCIPFLFNSSLYAAEGLKVANLEVIPWGEIKVQYDDNIFLDSEDEKDDLIFTLTPGIALEWLIEDHILKLDYHADINEFVDSSSQSATDHYLSGDLELNWRDIKFNVYDDFSRIFERPSTEDTSRVKRNDNRAGITAKLQKEKLGIQLGYEHFVRNYISEPAYEPYDRKENLYTFLITHQTLPKTKFLFEYDFGQIRYDDSTRSDSDYHQFLVGAIGELTPKTLATIKTGYQSRNYENDGDPDFSSGVLYGDITHRFSNKNALKLSFSKSARESTYDINNFYEFVNVSSVFDHYFNKKLLGFITGIYQVNSYPRDTTEGTQTNQREDKYYSIGTGLRYYMKDWLTFTLHIEHIERDSNFDVFGYDQNLITLTGKVMF